MTAHTENHSQELVIGWRGKTGRRVAQRLRDRGVPTRIGSRAALPPFDWDDSSTWQVALREVRRVYLTSYPDLAAPGSAAKVGELARLARKTGVERLVMSGRGEPEAQRSEQAVRDSFAAATIVRSSWFAQNFSESFLLESVLRGEIALPAGEAAEPFIDAADIADIAVAALTDDGHEGRVYEATGPEVVDLRRGGGGDRVGHRTRHPLPPDHAGTVRDGTARGTRTC